MAYWATLSVSARRSSVASLELLFQVPRLRLLFHMLLQLRLLYYLLPPGHQHTLDSRLCLLMISTY